MYELRCLGEASLRGPAGDLIHFRSRKHLALLIYLALNADRAHRRERLAGLLWSESESSKARHSLSQALYAVRRLLNGTVHIEGEDLELKPGWARIDALELERRLETGDAASAVELYRGEFLEGFWVRSARGFEEWAERERARVAALAREALRRSIKSARDRCEWSAVRDQAERLVQLDPFDEAAYGELMRALWMSGDRNGALTRYERLENVLARELGSRPSLETQELAKRIRDRSVRGGWQSRRLLRENEPPAFRDPPFVGRKRELSMLAAEWDRVKTGETRAVTLVGEAGIGKTRLAEEFIKSLQLEEVLVLRGRCYEAEQVLPYGPLAEAFRDGLDALDLSEVNPLWLAELARIVPEVAQKYGKLPEPPRLEAEGSQRRLYEGIAQVLREGCDQQPVLLFIDDLHWADDSSLALLHYLLRRVTNGLYLVASVRNDEINSEKDSAISTLMRANHTGTLQVSVEQLNLKDRSNLLESVVGANVDHETLLRLGGLSGGNPFFAVELAHAIRAGGCQADSRKQVVPANVRTLFERRFERLEGSVATILEQAAILGSRFSYEVLTKALDLREIECYAALNELSQAGILTTDGDDIRFRHNLIREVAKERIPTARRRSLHLRAARALIKSSGNPGEIARHLSFTKDSRGAYAYAIRGSKLAQELFAHDEAADLLALAIATAPGDFSTIDLTWQLARIYWHMRRYDKARPLLEKCLQALATQTGDSKGVVDCRTDLFLSELESGRRSAQESVGELRELFSIQASSANEASKSQAKILQMLLWIAARSGDRDLLNETAYKIGVLHERSKNPQVRWVTARLLGIHECYTGNLSKAEDLLRAALRDAEAAGDSNAVLECYVGFSVLAVRGRRLDLLEEILAQALPLARAFGDPVRVAQIQANCALLYAHCGELDTAEQLLVSARSALGSCDHLELSNVIRFNLGYVAFLRDDTEEAERAWTDDLEERKAIGRSASQAGCLAGLGLIAFQRGRIATARSFAAHALKVTRRTLAYFDERHLLEELLTKLRVHSGQHFSALLALLRVESEAKNRDIPLLLLAHRLIIELINKESLDRSSEMGRIVQELRKRLACSA